MKRSNLLRRTPLRSVSTKRAKEARLYAKKRKAFLEARPVCEWWAEVHSVHTSPMPDGTVLAWFEEDKLWEWAVPPASTEIHHKAGRSGANYLDESTWMACSSEGHRWITDHPKEAEARGWIIRTRKTL